MTLPGTAAAKQKGAHGSGLAQADGCDGAANVLHGIVDGETGGDATTRRVDVQAYGFCWIVGFEEQKLCDDGRGCCLVDSAIQADDAFAKET